jgi:DNA-binding winged helix-turn-helix (wHTH) protein/tetratricopeptide (TPR) repeat protein
MNRGDILVGDWLVQPSLDRVRRDGRVAHLRPKTMEVLIELAEHAGEVVTRDDLQRVVWRDVHVSEESLSHCVAEIRSVLGDDAKEPTYVETVAKHGYRLIAPVQPAASPVGGVMTAEAEQPGRRRAFAWSTPRVVLVVAIAAALIVAVGLGLRGLKPAPAGGPHLVVVADWENRTDDAVFDETLRLALSVALSQTPNIRVVSRERVAHALRLMRQPPDASLRDDLARRVCRRIGADLVAAGEIAKVGDQFVVIVEATLCSSATPFVQLQATADGKTQVLSAVNRVADGLRAKLGDAPAAEGSVAQRVEDVTTADLDALRAYTLASDALAERRLGEAIALFRHAIDLDPDFALAHSRLGSILAALREWKRANEHRRRAMALSDALTERERLYVNATFNLGLGRTVEAEDALKAWARLYPGDRVPLNWLAISHLNRGEVRDALAWGEAAVKVDPTSSTLTTLAVVYLSTGRIAQAKSVIEGVAEPGLRYLVAFLEGDTAEMARQHAAVPAGSVEEFDMRAREAQAAMAEGRVREARHLIGRTETLGLQLGLLELTAQVLATQAIWEAEIGDQRLAAEMAAAALSMGDNAATRAMAVLAFARVRATVRAQAVLRRVNNAPAETDPVISAGSRRKLAGAVAIASNQPAKALRQLAGLQPYEDGGVVNHVALRGDLAELGVFHLRGVARLALGEGQEAASEFQKILDRRGVSPLSPYCALAPLNLARARAAAGDVAAARRAYEAFLRQWDGADPDVSLVAEARHEYEHLPTLAAAPAK